MQLGPSLLFASASIPRSPEKQADNKTDKGIFFLRTWMLESILEPRSKRRLHVDGPRYKAIVLFSGRQSATPRRYKKAISFLHEIFLSLSRPAARSLQTNRRTEFYNWTNYLTPDHPGNGIIFGRRRTGQLALTVRGSKLQMVSNFFPLSSLSVSFQPVQHLRISDP